MLLWQFRVSCCFSTPPKATNHQRKQTVVELSSGNYHLELAVKCLRSRFCGWNLRQSTEALLPPSRSAGAVLGGLDSFVELPKIAVVVVLRLPQLQLHAPDGETCLPDACQIVVSRLVARAPGVPHLPVVSHPGRWPGYVAAPKPPQRCKQL